MMIDHVVACRLGRGKTHVKYDCDLKNRSNVVKCRLNRGGLRWVLPYFKIIFTFIVISNFQIKTRRKCTALKIVARLNRMQQLFGYYHCVFTITDEIAYISNESQTGLITSQSQIYVSYKGDEKKRSHMLVFISRM